MSSHQAMLTEVGRPLYLVINLPSISTAMRIWHIVNYHSNEVECNEKKMYFKLGRLPQIRKEWRLEYVETKRLKLHPGIVYSSELLPMLCLRVCRWSTVPLRTPGPQLWNTYLEAEPGAADRGQPGETGIQKNESWEEAEETHKRKGESKICQKIIV